MTLLNEKPMMLCVAPNGARLTKTDHDALPIGGEDLADCAQSCLAAGASMIHLHVRDDTNRHCLDVDRYLVASEKVRAAVGAEMVIQVTTEAVGLYSAAEQRAVVQAVKPEATSLGLRELLPQEATKDDEKTFADFWAWMRSEQIWPQVILYDVPDIERFLSLKAAGIFGDEYMAVLLVLGRYGRQLAQPHDLLPYLAALGDDESVDWSVCAFGQYEHACVSMAACLGGHARLGFENNRFLADGTVVDDNAVLIKNAADFRQAVGRPVMTAADIRQRYGMKAL